MADQNFSSFTPPSVLTVVAGPEHNQEVARGLSLFTPPSTVVLLSSLEHDQLSRTVTPMAGQGSLTVVHYLMAGSRVSDSAWISWEVTGVPDTAGTSAPQPVVGSSIMVVRRWTT